MIYPGTYSLILRGTKESRLSVEELDNNFKFLNNLAISSEAGTGTNGTSGTSGLQGIQGPTGQGFQGATGSNGTSGTSGSNGSSGTSGTSGTSGNQGVQGQQGPLGSQGIEGPVGASGLTWQGGWSNNSLYNMNDAVGYASASWWCVATVSSTSSVVSPDLDTLHDNWTLLAAQGSQGPQGSQGFQGPTGGNGTSGSSGTSGINGSSGTSGINGTNGTSGINGTNGTSGINGTNGTSGINGSSGTSGINGSSGTSGNGTSGSSGTSGSGTSGTSGTDALSIPNITISPVGPITTDSTGTSGIYTGLSQHGRNTKINATSSITLTCLTASNIDFISSYTKVGSGSINFLAGTGSTLTVMGGWSASLTGVTGSSALLTRNNNTYFLQLNNY